MAIPAAAFLIGTPASIKAREEDEIEAMEVEPLEEMISETILIV